MNAFANLPKRAAIANIEKTSVKSAVSGIILSQVLQAVRVNKASSRPGNRTGPELRPSELSCYEDPGLN